MTETTKTVFEKHEIRKSKKQKAAFAEYVQATATAEGYPSHIEPGSLGAKNIVVGNPETAKVVYTAHYDTCAVMPFPNFITPKNILIYILYQMLITFVLLLLPILPAVGLLLLLKNNANVDAELLGSLLYFVWLSLVILELGLVMAGPANRHTANDNTSGVTTLLDIMHALPAELRPHVAFIFFDLEEMGLFGSSGYGSIHKSVRKNTLLLNFDCVSDGDTILFAVNKGARPYVPAMEAAFPSTETLQAEVVTKGVFYPSDQASFICGVGVAALKRSKHGILYMDRIHTKNDTVYEEKNIEYLTEGAVRLAQAMAEHAKE